MGSIKTRMILNPAAGSVEGLEVLMEKVRAVLPKCEIYLTSGPGDLPKLAKRAIHDGCELLVAAGGDGTLNGVINGIADHLGEVQLGLLPLGTGNDFARSINVPRELDDALAVLRAGRSHRIDLIRAETASTQRYFVNVSTGGFSTKVSEFADSDLKETWGPLCYARSFIGALPELDDYHTRICLDGEEEITMPAYNVVVANARYVASGVAIAPTAELDDGLADVVILPVASLPSLAALAPVILMGKHLTSDKIIHRRARRIEITSTPPMKFNTDGELLPAEAVTFEVLPGVLDFIVGPQPAQDDQPALKVSHSVTADPSIPAQ